MAQSWRLWVIDQKMVVKILWVGTRAGEVAIVRWSYDLQSTELWVEASNVMVFSVNDLVSRIVLSLGKGITSENGELRGIVKIACTVKVAGIVVRWNDKLQSTESQVMVLSVEELVSRIAINLGRGITSRRGKLRTACTIKVAGTLMGTKEDNHSHFSIPKKEIGLLILILIIFFSPNFKIFTLIIYTSLKVDELIGSIRASLGMLRFANLALQKDLIESLSLQTLWARPYEENEYVMGLTRSHMGCVSGIGMCCI